MNWRFRVGVVLVLFAAALYYKTVFDPGLGPPLDDQSVFQELVQEPKVLVYTTHGTENYTPGELFAHNADGDIVSVAQELKDALQFNGVSVLQDTTLNDVPVYKDAYINSRATVSQILQSNPTIQILLDIHRGISDHPKTQKKDETTCYTAGNTPAAKIQFIVGKANPGWDKNLAFAKKLRMKLEAVAPGLCAPKT